MPAADLLRLDSQLAPFATLVDALAPGDPLLAVLRQRIAALRAMVDGTVPAANPGAAEAAHGDVKSALVAFINQWKPELSRTVLAGLPELPSLHHALAAADWFSPDGFATGAELGPLALRIGLDQVVIAVEATVSGGGTAALAPLAIGPSRLDRVAASLAGPFPGDGALRILADGCSGALRLPLGAVIVDALASLRRTATGGPSFLAVIGAAFTPGIQLPFGFAIDRVGGVIGIERRVDRDALSLGIRSGSATAVLFSPPGADLQRRLTSAEVLFPPAPGQHVVGPLFGLAWLSLGPDAALVHADVGVLVQLGGPVTIVIVGSGRLTLGEVLRIQADLAGSVDLARGRVAVDVSLVEARLLGAFRATGDAAFRATTSDSGATVFSAGGFYPGFDPKPAEIGPLRRLSLGTDIPTPGLDIRIEGYFAATSNTIQLGGRLDVVFDAALVVARGSVGLDALVQFSPFHFHAGVYGQVSVEFLGETFCGVRVDAIVDGPGPISVAARLTIETFLKDIPWNETFTFGEGEADRVNRVTDLVEAVALRAAHSGALRASAPDDPAVVLEPLAANGVVLGPLGELVWSQRHSPLHVLCDRFESEPLDPPGQGVLVAVVAPAVKRHEEKEPFAPGSFLNLPENLALHVPAFDPQVAGIRIGFNDEPGDTRPQPPATRVLVLPVLVPLAQALKDWNLLVATPGQAWLRSVADVGLAAPRVWNRTAQVTAVGETWRTWDGAGHATVTGAWQHARHAAGGVPLHSADPVLDTASF
jgi:hypothetical protein